MRILLVKFAVEGSGCRRPVDRELHRFLIRQIQRNHFFLRGFSFRFVLKFIGMASFYQFAICCAHLIRVGRRFQPQYAKWIPHRQHLLFALRLFCYPRVCF